MESPQPTHGALPRYRDREYYPTHSRGFRNSIERPFTAADHAVRGEVPSRYYPTRPILNHGHRRRGSTADDAGYERVEKEGLSVTLSVKRNNEPRPSFNHNNDDKSGGILEALAWKQPSMVLSDATCELFAIHALEYSDEDGNGKTTLVCPGGPRKTNSDTAGVQLRWLHVQQQAPNMKTLQKILLHCPFIPNDLLSVALTAIDEAEARFFKVSENGSVLEPGSIIRVIGKYHDEGQKSPDDPPYTEPVVFLTSPHLTLQKPVPRSSVGDGFGARTLLQCLYGYDVGGDRENSQVVKKTGMSKQLIHMNQMWCMLIGSGILITFAEQPAQAIRGNTITVDDMTSGSGEPLTLRLFDEHGRSYNSVIDPDYTYADLLMHAVALVRGRLQDALDFELVGENDEVLTPTRWLELLASSASQPLLLYLRQKGIDEYEPRTRYRSPPLSDPYGQNRSVRYGGKEQPSVYPWQSRINDQVDRENPFRPYPTTTNLAASVDLDEHQHIEMLRRERERVYLPTSTEDSRVKVVQLDERLTEKFPDARGPHHEEAVKLTSDPRTSESPGPDEIHQQFVRLEKQRQDLEDTTRTNEYDVPVQHMKKVSERLEQKAAGAPDQVLVSERSRDNTRSVGGSSPEPFLPKQRQSVDSGSVKSNTEDGVSVSHVSGASTSRRYASQHREDKAKATSYAYASSDQSRDAVSGVTDTAPGLDNFLTHSETPRHHISADLGTNAQPGKLESHSEDEESQRPESHPQEYDTAFPHYITKDSYSNAQGDTNLARPRRELHGTYHHSQEFDSRSIRRPSNYYQDETTRYPYASRPFVYEYGQYTEPNRRSHFEGQRHDRWPRRSSREPPHTIHYGQPSYSIQGPRYGLENDRYTSYTRRYYGQGLEARETERAWSKTVDLAAKVAFDVPARQPQPKVFELEQAEESEEENSHLERHMNSVGTIDISSDTSDEASASIDTTRESQVDITLDLLRQITRCKESLTRQSLKLSEAETHTGENGETTMYLNRIALAKDNIAQLQEQLLIVQNSLEKMTHNLGHVPDLSIEAHYKEAQKWIEEAGKSEAASSDLLKQGDILLGIEHQKVTEVQESNKASPRSYSPTQRFHVDHVSYEGKSGPRMTPVVQMRLGGRLRHVTQDCRDFEKSHRVDGSPYMGESKKIDMEVLSLPFLAWRTKGKAKEQGPGQIDEAIWKILGFVHRSLLNERFGKLYSQGFNCTISDVRQRHAFILKEPSVEDPGFSTGNGPDNNHSSGLGGTPDEQCQGVNVEKPSEYVQKVQFQQTDGQEDNPGDFSSSRGPDGTRGTLWNLPPSQSIQPTSHYRMLLKQFLELSEEILWAFIPQKSSILSHHTAGRFWGAVDAIFRQVEWDAGNIGNSQERVYVISGYSNPSAASRKQTTTSAKRWEECADCSTSKHYSVASEALRHIHENHRECSGKVDRPFDDPCLVWVHRVWKGGHQVQRPGIGILDAMERFITDLTMIRAYVKELKSLTAQVQGKIERRPPLPNNLVEAFREILTMYVTKACTLSMMNRQDLMASDHETRDRRRLLINKLDELRTIGEVASFEAQERLHEAKRDILLLGTTSRHIRSIGAESVGAEFLVLSLMINMQNREIFSSASPYHQVHESRFETDYLQAYSDYSKRLRFQAHHRPRRRLFLDIAAMQEELEALSMINETQALLLSKYLSLIEPHSFRVTNQTRLRLDRLEWPRLVKQHRLLDGRGSQIRDLDQGMEYLKSQVRQTVEIVDEDHGKAIRVFTIVTLFFLPLSFVTSFMGMNTADIRDMDHSQNIFWMTSIPVTVGVVAMACIYGYRGEEIADWAREWLRSRRNSRKPKLQDGFPRRRIGKEPVRQTTMDSLGF